MLKYIYRGRDKAGIFKKKEEADAVTQPGTRPQQRVSTKSANANRTQKPAGGVQ